MMNNTQRLSAQYIGIHQCDDASTMHSFESRQIHLRILSGCSMVFTVGITILAYFAVKF